MFFVAHACNETDRIESNFQQVELSDETFAKLSAIGHNNRIRFNIPYRYNPSWSINVFDEEVEQTAEHRPKPI